MSMMALSSLHEMWKYLVFSRIQNRNYMNFSQNCSFFKKSMRFKKFIMQRERGKLQRSCIQF